MKATVILGAGFSNNSGLPLESQIPARLLQMHGMKEAFDNQVSAVLERFAANVFGKEAGSSMPQLDDMLTCMDLSTNSGHHLSIAYPPAVLRSVRRFLVYRVYRLLEESFRYNPRVSELLQTLCGVYEPISFVVLNWDTVLEKYLMAAEINGSIDYGTGGRNLSPEHRASLQTFPVLKLHGSSNWLYCDNCRTLFHDLEDRVPLLKRAGFLRTDFELFEDRTADPEEADVVQSCCLCGNSISAHIATFSYRKSFRTNSFPQIWKEAEQQLSSSQRWIFIGYSLPQADYEFKHLLKISQLKLAHIRPRVPVMDVVLQNSTGTPQVYESFFGRSRVRIFNEGIEAYTRQLQAGSINI